MIKNTETSQPSLSRDHNLQTFLGFKPEEIASQDKADEKRALARADNRERNERRVARQRKMATRIGAGVVASAITLAGANGLLGDGPAEEQKQVEYDQENKEQNIRNNPELFGQDDPTQVTIEVKGGDLGEGAPVEVRKGGPEPGSPEAGQDN